MPSPVYVPGTTDVKPLLTRIAPKLAAAAGADQLTIVYQGVSSCTAVDDVLSNTTLQGNATYWTGAVNADGGAPVEATCVIPAGTKADMALSDVTVRTCTGADIPSGFGQISSVVQTFGFVVPPNSSQTAITAAEAYFILKYGGAAGKQAPPWIDPNFIIIRSPAASTRLLIGLLSGVPGNLWSAALTNVKPGSSDVITAVAAENSTGNAEKTIGILSTQRYDSNRDKLKLLAFEAFKQCLGAVFPDSKPTAFDKRNVRDGHYAIWGYLWSVGAADTGGAFTNARASKLASLLSGTQAINGADPIADPAKVGAIPQCAMKVKRAYDGAPLEPYTPAAPCSCQYELQATGTTSCTACSNGACPGGGTCNFGYCEK